MACRGFVRVKHVCLAFLLHSWLLRIFWVGYRRDLEVTDLYTPLKEHTSGILGVKLVEAWDKEVEAYQRRLDQVAKGGSRKKVKEPSLLKVLVRCFGFKTLLYGLFLAVTEIFLRYNHSHFSFRNPPVKSHPELFYIPCIYGVLTNVRSAASCKSLAI